MTATAARLSRLNVPSAVAPFAAAALALVSLCCAIAAIVIHAELAEDGITGVQLTASDVVLATAFPLVAAVIILYQPRNLVGWLLLSTALMGSYLLAGQYAAQSLEPGRQSPARRSPAGFRSGDSRPTSSCGAWCHCISRTASCRRRAGGRCARPR